MFAGDYVLLLVDLFPETFHYIVSLRGINLGQRLLELSLHLNDDLVERLNFDVLLLGEELQISQLSLCLLGFGFECTFALLAVLLELDHFQVKFVIFLDDALVLLLQWFILYGDSH